MNKTRRIVRTVMAEFVLLISCGCTVLAQQPSQTPDTRASQEPDLNSVPKIQVRVNAVIVPVVVRDEKGQLVAGLKKEDFEVRDNHKLADITGFSIQNRPSGKVPVASALAVRDEVKSAAVTTATPARSIVFLFDDMHLTQGDLLEARHAATKMLGEALTSSDAAAVVSFSGINSGLTRNRAKLQEAIGKVRVQSLYRHQGRECPDIDYYLADLIENQHSNEAFESAVQDAQTCAKLESRIMAEGITRTASRHALTVGDQDVHVTLSIIREIVSKMAALPGERMLILVSPGFYTMTASALSEKSQILDAAARANVTVSALDARGLYTTGIDASENGARTMAALQTGSQSQYHRDSMQLFEDVMAELADGSGGTFFHNSNDLEGGLKSLAAVPEYVYLLEIPMDEANMNGAYHSLSVKVNKKNVKVQARRGYFAPKAKK